MEEGLSPSVLHGVGVEAWIRAGAALACWSHRVPLSAGLCSPAGMQQGAQSLSCQRSPCWCPCPHTNVLWCVPLLPVLVPLCLAAPHLPREAPAWCGPADTLSRC